MRVRSFSHRPSRATRASALVVVLAVTVAIAVIAVSLAVAMRLELQAANSYAERSRAELASDEGVAAAKMLLSGVFADDNVPVVTMPGRAATWDPGTTNWRLTELSSRLSTSAGGGVFAAADLNRIVRTGDGMRGVDPLGPEMPLRWVYIYRDGGDRFFGDGTPPISAANPIVGRYAFWVDDESTRINLNTAKKRTDNQHVPAQVDIASASEELTDADADLIFQRSRVRPIQSLEEVRQVSPEISDVIAENRFAFTHYNRSTNLNPWGEPKILLTTQVNNLPPEIRNLPVEEREKYFLDILTTENSDPGRGNSISFPKLTRLLNRLNGYLTRTDWPHAPGKSFESKFKSYSSPSEKRITQLALEIIQYVRSAESVSPAVTQIRGRWNGDNFVVSSTQEDLFASTARTPFITEVSAWVSPQRTGEDGSYEFQLRFEVFLPANFGIEPVDLTELRFLVQATGSTLFQSTAITADIASPTILSPGGFAVITTPVIPLKTAPTETSPAGPPFTDANVARMYLRVVLLNAFNEFLDQATVGNRITALGSADPSGIEYFLERPAATSPPLDGMPSAEVDDPRTNKVRTQWTLRSSGNSFGAANSNWKQSPMGSDGLPQDRDGATYSDSSLSLPGPKGSEGNELGRVSSVAELGRIPTGIETHGVYKDRVIPWRTLRLQPTTEDDEELPDWALLDLFAAPVIPDPEREELYFTAPNRTGGSININAYVEPFGLGKRQSLAALFGDPDHPAIENILTFTRAAGGRAFGGSGEFYTSVGELAEIEGVSDSGESSEETLRKIASQAVVTGSTFRIFSIGQSLTQTPAGELVVTGSRSVETLVEPVAGTDPPTFRSLTWKQSPF